MKSFLWISVACLLCGMRPAFGSDQAPPPVFSISLETWLHGSATHLKADSLLNPHNLIAKLPSRKWTLDGRLDIRGELGPFDLLLAPRVLQEASKFDGGGHASTGSLRLNQGFIRSKFGSDTFLLGRERLTWGPANFRSPSNPYYFDSGRTNPLAATPGIDLVRYTHGAQEWRFTPGYVASTHEVSSAELKRRSVFLKLDHQGESHLISVIAARAIRTSGDSHTSPFIGAFAQISLDDAWLIYGEASSSMQPASTRTMIDNTAAQREERVLIGASYTQENGNVILAEYLHNDAGLSNSEERHYYSQALTANMLVQSNKPEGYQILGLLSQNQPRLIGRDYLWLGWQSNPQNTSLMWRAELSINANDRSAQSLLYLEKTLLPRVAGFIALNRNMGPTTSEYGAYSTGQLTIGIKWFGL